MDAGNLAAERERRALDVDVEVKATEEGGDEEGDEGEESPSHEGAMQEHGVKYRSGGHLQGVQRLSAREVALVVQGVRWGLNLRARSYTLSLQRMPRGEN